MSGFRLLGSLLGWVVKLGRFQLAICLIAALSAGSPAFAQHNPASTNRQSRWYVPTADSSVGNALAIWTNVADPIYGGSGDGAAIQAAINATPSYGAVYIPRGIYRVNSTITMATHHVDLISEGAVILDTVLGGRPLWISSSWHNIRGIKFLGAKDQDEANVSIGIQIDSAVSNITIRDCQIVGFKYGINATEAHKILIEGCRIDTIFIGIKGGANYVATQNDTTGPYKIVNNFIRCTYGALRYSRPVNLWFGNNYLVDGNTLLGGGMSVEAVKASAQDTTGYSEIVTNNTCDAAISAGRIITHNNLDTRLKPTGRGPESDFPQAIEPGGRGALIAGNRISYFQVGISTDYDACSITDNYFYRCGDPAWYPGVIYANPDATGAPESKTPRLIITGNIFEYSVVADIDIRDNGPFGTDTTNARGGIISHNISSNGQMQFLLLDSVQQFVVTDNVIRNSCKSFTPNLGQYVQAFQEKHGCSNYYTGNEVYNDTTPGVGGNRYGMNWPMYLSSGSTVGTNRSEGMLGYAPSYLLALPNVIAPQVVDGATYYPPTLRAGIPYVTDTSIVTGGGVKVGTFLAVGGDITTSGTKIKVSSRGSYSDDALVEIDAADAGHTGYVFFSKGGTALWDIRNDGTGFKVHDWTSGGDAIAIATGTDDISFRGSISGTTAAFSGDVAAANTYGVTWDTVQFFGTNARVAKYLAGTASDDRFVIQDFSPDGLTAPLAGDRCQPFAKTDSCVVIRSPSSNTSGLVVLIGRLKP